jgi:hypothetical protein
MKKRKNAATVNRNGRSERGVLSVAGPVPREVGGFTAIVK